MRVPTVLRRFLPHRPRSRKEWLLLVVLLGGLGIAGGVGTTAAVHYTETAGFCVRCHAMQPEVAAYQRSPHKEVACAECHVSPGVSGFVRAKAKGTRQLVEVLTGQFPRPVPPPDHADLPAVRDTCLHCHTLDSLRPRGRTRLVMRPHFDSDARSTREDVAVALRPDGLEPDGGASKDDALGGAHGHVRSRVTFTSGDPQAQTVDLVEVTLPDGTRKQFVSRAEAGTANQPAAVVARLRADGRTRVMDCLDCHNRVGHEPADPDRAVDDLLAAGTLDRTVPFAKRDALAVLTADHPSEQAAEAAIDRVAATAQAARALRTAYRLVAVPAMQVGTSTYADNLGHRNGPGCFRCHDGNHVRVVDGRLTGEVIPSTCATCHSFPQLAGLVSSYLPDGRPTSHAPRTWALTHKARTPSTDPAGTSCAACHRSASCESCHRTGAVKVRHAQILRTHPAQVAALGPQSCLACHRTRDCVSCHTTGTWARPASREERR